MARRDADELRKPALRISHIVYGRQGAAGGGRVSYLVDPNGAGDERAGPESVVLRRWRRRRFDGWTFHGDRLSSTVWRAIPALLGAAPVSWCRLSVGDLTASCDRANGRLRQEFLSAPAAETMWALFRVCGSDRLAALVERHRVRSSENRSGVPDLFLYAKNPSGEPGIARFVEVKKPEESVSPDQRDEIVFMNGLGLHARVLRLIERDALGVACVP